MFSYAVSDGGGGYGVVTDRFVLAISEAVPLTQLIELWELLSLPETAIEDALSLVTQHGIAQLPDFALVELVDVDTGSVTVAVRGTGTVKVGGAHSRVFEGTGAVTWIEASAQRIDLLAVSVAASDGRSPETSAQQHLRLPFKRGVVKTDHLFWGIPVEFAGETSHPPDDATVLSSFRTAQEKRDVTPDDAIPDDATVLSARKSEPKWVLEFESGSTLRIDTPVTVGRAPRDDGEARPIPLPSPTREVSGSHARLAGNRDSLLLTDLNSTNGTIVTAAGERPQIIHGGRSHELRVGDRVDFGDGNIAVVARSAQNRAAQ